MKTSKFLVFLMLISLCLVECVKEEIDSKGNIRGKVVDALTDEPLQGVNITVSPKGYSSVTGNDGVFEIVDLDPGQYSVQAQKSGYKTNYKQITIYAGETGVGDMSLTPLQTTSAVQIKPESLNFGKKETEMTFEITNYGNYGSIKWNMSGVEPSWIKVTPFSGEIGQGMSSSVKVSIERSFLVDEISTTYVQVNYPGGSKSVKVTVEK